VQARRIWDEWGLSNHEEILGKQMAYADAQLRKVPMVQGVACFQYGEQNSEAWKLFDLKPVDFVPHYIANLKPGDPPPPPPPPEAPSAIFAIPEGIKAGDSFTLEAVAIGTATSYKWEYPNGVPLTNKTITLAFANPGSYPVTLTISGPGGTSAPFTGVIVVAPADQDDPPDEPPQQPRPPMRVIFRIQLGKVNIGAWWE
jgi:hypothetical protein